MIDPAAFAAIRRRLDEIERANAQGKDTAMVFWGGHAGGKLFLSIDAQPTFIKVLVGDLLQAATAAAACPHCAARFAQMLDMLREPQGCETRKEPAHATTH